MKTKTVPKNTVGHFFMAVPIALFAIAWVASLPFALLASAFDGLEEVEDDE